MSSLIKLSVQAASVSSVLSKSHPCTQHVKEPIHGHIVTSVSKQSLLVGLTHPLVDHPELEVVHQHVLVVVDQELRT